MFDKVTIRVRGGNGGDGAISFRREKYVPFGGPDGGDGGDGGRVILQADPSVTDLRTYRSMTVHHAANGGQGGGNKMSGKNGVNLVLKVPPGTIVSSAGESGLCLLNDLESPGQEAVVATGGHGGRGDARFATSTTQAPHISEKGEPGQQLTLTLEMRLIADVGIIGQPNAGKSSLLAAASAANPKIADYPFTTIEPILGVVHVGEENTFILAEIPGLIEGAHLGKGLGHEFLRHAMRTRLLIHLLDGASPNPVEDMIKINHELTEFDPTLAAKPQILVLNKVDLPELADRLEEVKKHFKEVGLSPLFISAATGQGVPELMAEAYSRIAATMLDQEDREAKNEETVFHPAPREPEIFVTKNENTFVVTAPFLERINGPQGVSNPDMLAYVRKHLERHNLRRLLLREGIKPGDKVRYGPIEWMFWE